MGNFTRGLAASISGLRRALGNPDVRRAYFKIAAVIVGLTLVLDLVGLWALWHSVGTNNGDVGAVGILWRILATLMMFLLGPMIVVVSINVVFPMFNAIPFLAGLRAIDPQRAAMLSARPGLPVSRSIAVSLLRLARFLMLGALAFAVSFIPIVGPVLGPALQLAFSATALGWELLDPYFDKLGFTYPAQRSYLARHRASIVGFGLPYAVLFAIPFVGPLFFGLAQAATATLVSDVLEQREPTPERAVATVPA